MTVAGVASHCAVSVRTVYRWIERDGLPVHRLPGAGASPITRVSRHDLDDWLSTARQAPADVGRDDVPKLRLDGRKFIQTKAPSAKTKIRLDTPRARASRGQPERSRQR